MGSVYRAISWMAWPWLLLLGLLGPARGAEPVERQPLARAEKSLAGWLRARGLAQQISVERLRYTARPQGDSRWLLLELRHLTQSVDAEREVPVVVAQWKRLGAPGEASFAETLFYKLVQLAGVDRKDACVEVYVVDQSFTIFRDPQQRRLVVRHQVPRMTRQQLALNGLLLRPPGADAAGVVRGDEAPRRVKEFLERYFKEQNQTMKLPPPQINPKPVESDYVGLEVAGIKGQALPEKRSWEQLQIDIDFEGQAAGYRTIWHLSGKYAPGLGSSSPSDYDDVIPDPALRRLSERLTHALQEELRRKQ